jgi:hypothetical protein
MINTGGPCDLYGRPVPIMQTNELETDLLIFVDSDLSAQPSRSSAVAIFDDVSLVAALQQMSSRKRKK